VTAPHAGRGQEGKRTSLRRHADHEGQSSLPRVQPIHVRPVRGVTVIILAVLVLVIGYLISIGWRSVSVSFFTQNRKPYGSAKYPGGMLNGLVGTSVLLALASVVGIPYGILAGAFLSEYSANSRLATPVRFVADVLAGRAEYCGGHTWLRAAGGSSGGYNGWAGALALGVHHDPDRHAYDRGNASLVPKSYREASIALGATRRARSFASSSPRRRVD